MADLNTKYQKLATEYAKLRSQVGVLKKGVLEEQEKNQQLTDLIHERDTQLRKHESEMEGVLFRNQQLTKRVNVLQDEIDGFQVKSKSKKRNGSQNRDEAERVINEELVSKITENARLHATLDDIEKQYENTILSLQNRVQDLEKEKSLLGNAQKNKEEELSDTVSIIEREKDELRSRVTNLERDLALRSKQNESLEVQVSVLSEKNRSLESVSRTDFCSQFSFIDPELEKEKEQKNRELDSLNTRVSELVSRLQEVEKDREHWKLEHQLSQIKLDKQHQGDQDSHDGIFVNDNEIKSVFKSRLEELVVQRIEADSKSTAYYLECEALLLKVDSLEKTINAINDDLTNKRGLLWKGEEDIKTMQLNYEEQLSVMSDHLAEMNNKLASQEDTIIHLRQECDLSEKKKKK